MFEWNEPEQRLEALHHPFTAPRPEDMDDLPSARALAYDMVYNGVEVHKQLSHFLEQWFGRSFDILSRCMLDWWRKFKDI